MNVRDFIDSITKKSKGGVGVETDFMTLFDCTTDNLLNFVQVADILV